MSTPVNRSRVTSLPCRPCAERHPSGATAEVRALVVGAVLRAELSARIDELRRMRAVGAQAEFARDVASVPAERPLERAMASLVVLAAFDPEAAAEPWEALCELAGHRIIFRTGCDRTHRGLDLRKFSTVDAA